MLKDQVRAIDNSDMQPTDSLLCGNVGHLERVGVLSYRVAAFGGFANVTLIHLGYIQSLFQVGYKAYLTVYIVDHLDFLCMPQFLFKFRTLFVFFVSYS